MEFPTVNGIAGKSPNEWSGDHMMQQLQQTPHPYLLHPYPSDRIEDILVPATGINNLASTAGSVLAIAMDDPIDRLAKQLLGFCVLMRRRIRWNKKKRDCFARIGGLPRESCFVLRLPMDLYRKVIEYF